MFSVCMGGFERHHVFYWHNFLLLTGGYSQAEMLGDLSSSHNIPTSVLTSRLAQGPLSFDPLTGGHCSDVVATRA